MPLGLPPVPKVSFKPSGVLRIGYMGNINYSKGLGVAVRELAPLLTEKKVTLAVYGHPYDQGYYDEIKTASRRFPPGAVELHGRYRNTFEELWRIFSSFDVLVFPSVWEENAPLVVREALLAGRPVIGSRLGGVPEIVKDGHNGFTFNPFVPGDLEDKIRKLLTDPGLLHPLWEGAGKTQIEPIEDHADKMIHLYEDVINHAVNNPPGVRQ
jgi:glycosyltransferase involved in cell wall biosynthesis